MRFMTNCLTTHRRKNHIRVERDAFVPRDLSHQILPDGTVVTGVIGLDGAEIKGMDGVSPSKYSAEIQTDCFETDFYTVRINNRTKKITGIFDKALGVELIDKEARFELAQFVYAYTEHKTDPSLNYEVPKKLDLKVYEGDVANVIVQTGYEEQSGAEVTAQLTFYKHERTFDVDLSYKNALGLIGDFYDRYKKNYFFAFPFKLDNPQFYTELAVGERHEGKDCIPLNASDFSVTQGWVAVENERCGVAVYTRDMPVFHLGSIKYNQFQREFSEDKAHVFLYAASNRCNNLIYTKPEECKASYRLSLLPYGGKHNDIVPSWSNENEHGLLICREIPDSRLLKLSERNVRLVSLKKAEDCSDAVVLRFVETAGEATECNLELFFKPSRAVYVTNDERELEETDFDGNTVRFKCQPYFYTALKVYGDFDIAEC